MDKKIIIFVTAIILILSSADTVFAEDDSINVEAASSLQQIEELQKEQQQNIQFQENARQLRSQAEASGQGTEMPADMAAYMDARGLVYDTTGNDLLMDAYEWTVAIGSLENYQQTINTKSQQVIANLQDFMGQYNSYISGANAQISQSHETLVGIARGQSMYGTSEAGLAITALVLGLALGCVVTLGVQKLGRKRRTE